MCEPSNFRDFFSAIEPMWMKRVQLIALEADALFPRLYQHGITEPPDIMKEEHAEFRARKKALYALVNKGTATPFAEFKQAVFEHGGFISRELESHIFKEDNIRPALQDDGGDVELLDVSEEGAVQVELVGACGGCPMSQMTLKDGIERRLKELVPEVTRVYT